MSVAKRKYWAVPLPWQAPHASGGVGWPATARGVAAAPWASGDGFKVCTDSPEVAGALYVYRNVYRNEISDK